MEITKQQRNTWIGFGVGVVVIVVIILALTLPQKNTENGERPTPDADDAGTVAVAMEPYVEGEFTYQFEDVAWVFNKADEKGVGTPVTVVRAQLKNLTRGTYQFSPTYRLGTYEGDCEEVPTVTYNGSQYEGRPLSYAVCTTGNAKTEFIALQQGKDIIFLSRSHGTEEDASDFETIFTLDITTTMK